MSVHTRQVSSRPSKLIISLYFVSDLNELNRWMEEFVRNGHSSIDALSGRVAHIQDLIEPPPAATPHLGQEPTPMPVGVVGQIASLRDMVEAVRDRLDRESDGDVNQQRLESLLGSVEMERQRYQQQNSCAFFSPHIILARPGLTVAYHCPSSAIENVVSLLDRQRLENQELLKAMVHGESHFCPSILSKVLAI